MKILFWNIGKKLSDTKLNLISEAIEIEKPDIFCIAEGSNSKVDCERIIELFIRPTYTCYYSPLAYLASELNLNYEFNPNGLKIFIRKHELAKERFSFSHQRNEGRIVGLKTDIDFYKPTTLIFSHNSPKSGNLKVTDNQRVFISELKMLLDMMGRVPLPCSRVL